MPKKRATPRRSVHQLMQGLSFDVKTAVQIGGSIFAIAALYYGLTNKIDVQNERLSQQTQAVTTLTNQVQGAQDQNRALERALIEVIATLKAKKVIQ